jgi:hypothetical protein
MPTANTASPPKAKTGAKSAAKRSATRRAPSTARARKTTKSKATRAKSTRAKAARTRATNQTRSAVRQAEAVARYRSAPSFSDYAERAVLIPFGVALTARDRVVSRVNDTISTYSSTTKTQAQLRRFERRGATARNRFEREVRKTRVRVERELRQRRREIEKTVSDLEARRDRVPELANRVQERILNLV